MIRIDVPATSANLGSGFDSLGIALTMKNRCGWRSPTHWRSPAWTG